MITKNSTLLPLISKHIQGVSKKTRPLEINLLLLSTRFYAPGNLK